MSLNRKANYLPVLFVLSGMWTCLLALLPGTQRYFNSGERVFYVIASVFVILLLVILIRGKKLLYAIPIVALNIIFIIGMYRHPYYTLTDYLLYDSNEEEKSVYVLLCELEAHAGIDEGRISSIIFKKYDVSLKLLQSLKTLSKLGKIDLNNTNITDADLTYLENMSQLHYVDLSTTEVTDSGVKRLQKALPNLTIKH
jgi:hypothetical protein